MWIGVILFAAFVGFLGFGLGKGLGTTIKESHSNMRIRLALRHRQSRVAARERYVDKRDEHFKRGVLVGRRWLATFVAEAGSTIDARLETRLRDKDRPALRAAEAVATIRAEKRRLKEQAVFLTYQLKSYEEYFPFLEEFRDLILDERVALGAGQDNEATIREADRSLGFLSTEEYEKLSVTERNQLALDRYVDRTKNNWEIGRLYERYLGYRYESRGWRVEFHGAIKGFDDFGRDLICTKGGTILIVQAKCWSKTKTIHEKHLFQLYGSCIHYRLSHPHTKVAPIFACTTELSEPATVVAQELGIRVSRIDLPKTYPMIKCNINPATRERIYHLPFDQQYDRVVIGAVPGERYAQTVREAEALGFRRAWRHVVWQSK